MNNFNFRNIGILSAILIVPILITLLLRTGTTKLLPLPVYSGHQKLDSKTSEIGGLKLSEYGVSDSWQDDNILLHLTFLENNELSEHAKFHLNSFANRLSEVSDIKLVTICSQCDFTPEISFNKDWFSLKIDSIQFHLLAEKILEEIPSGNEISFVETDLVVLLDRQRRIRGYYPAANDRFEKELLSELIVLRDEYNH